MPRRQALVAVAYCLLLPAVCFSVAGKRGDIPSSTNGIDAASECPLVNGNQTTPFLARFDGHTVPNCEDADGNPLSETYADRSAVIADNSNFAIKITPIGWAFSFTILEIRFTVKSTNTLSGPALRTMAFKGNQRFGFVPCNEPALASGLNSSFATGDKFYTSSLNYGTTVFACMSTPVLAIPVVDGIDRTQYNGDKEIYLQEPDGIYDTVNDVTILDFTTLKPGNGSDAVAYVAISGVPAAILSDMNTLNELVGRGYLTANGLDYSSAGVHYVVADGSSNRYEGGSVSLSFPNCTIQGSGCQSPANDSVSSPTNITTATFQDNIDVTNATQQDINDPVSGCYDGGDGTTAFSNNAQFKTYRSVWYALNAQNPGSVEINTDSSRYDTRVDVFSGKPTSSSTSIACNDDYTPPHCQICTSITHQQSDVLLSLAAKGTYYIMVSETAKPPGSVVLSDGDLIPVNNDGQPPYTAGTIPLAASAILTVNVTTTGLSGDKSALNFAAQHVSTTSSALSVNMSAPTGSIGSISPQASGDFAISSNGCSGVTLSSGTTCGVQVTFKPTADGTRSGTLTIGSNAVIGPLTIGLSGNGYIPQANFNTQSLTFSVQNLNTTSAAQKVMIANGGDGPLTIASFTASSALAPFAYTTTCGASVAASSSCEFDFTFTPTSPGAASATFTINDDAPSGGSSQTVMLNGTGSGVVVGPSPTMFPNTIARSYSAAQTIMLQNSMSTTLTVSQVQISGPFKIASTTCGATPFLLTSGISCSYSVQFAPATTGATSGALTFLDNATTGNGMQSVALSGTGVDVTITPSRPGLPTRAPASSPSAVTNTLRLGVHAQTPGSLVVGRAIIPTPFDSRLRLPATAAPLPVRLVVVWEEPADSLEASPEAEDMERAKRELVTKNSK